jgi:hypothetical protein
LNNIPKLKQLSTNQKVSKQTVKKILLEAHLSLDGSAKLRRRDRDYLNVCDVLCPRTIRLTSTDGAMTVLKPRSLGKKIGQRKRKINERTTTFKKKKTTTNDGQTVK